MAQSVPHFGHEPRLEGPGDTTYFNVADRDGMMVSLSSRTIAAWAAGASPTGCASCSRTGASSSASILRTPTLMRPASVRSTRSSPPS